MRRLVKAFARIMPLGLIALVAMEAYATPTTFVSDDFNSNNLKRPLWTFTDPLGDGQLVMSGVGTDSASVTITVPGGSDHDLWTNGYEVPRILQAATNTDFQIEAKFLSGISGVSNQAFAVQGIVVEADANNVLRFDFTTGNSDSLIAFSAAFIGGFSSPSVKINKNIGAYGTKPLYLRVNRTGNTWKMYYSFTGVVYALADSFSQALTVTKVGAFVGNAGSKSKSVTAKIDYFFNSDSTIASEDGGPVPTDNLSPLISGVKVIGLEANAFRVEWYTDEPADGTLEYGTTLSYGNSVSHGGLFNYHILTVENTAANTLYNYRIIGADVGAHSGPSGNFTVMTPVARPTDASSVSDDFNGTTLNSSVWTYTNPKSDATLSVAGKTVSIALPVGSAHDLWTTGNTVPRIMQPIQNQNFEIIAKFNSGLNGNANAIPVQGILVQQDSANLIRFDLNNSGAGTAAFAATFIGGLSNPSSKFSGNIAPTGTAPVYIRVRRDGARYWFDYSLDGASYTTLVSFYEFLAPTQVGVFAGNPGTSPQAFTMIVDLFQASLPATPALVSPPTDSMNVSATPTLAWDTTTNASSFRLQVSVDSLFSSFAYNDSTITGLSKQVTGLANQTKYFWRVRAKNASGVSPNSSVRSFTTVQPPPAAPTPLLPADNAKDLDTAITVRWTSSPTAVTYRLQLGTDSTFAGGFVINDSTLTDTSKSVVALDYGVRYFWRVNSKNPGGTSAYSALRRFTTFATDPTVPVPVLPVSGATNLDTNVTLRWTRPIGNPTSYRLQVGTDSTFGSGVVLDDPAVADTSRVVGGLSFLTKYYWRVNADAVGGVSPFSAPANFTTGLTAPGQVNLLLPVNQASISADSATFRWNKTQPNVTRYWHELAVDSLFTFVVIDSSVTDTSKVVHSLNNNQTYYWRVRAYNQSGWGPFSAVRRFAVTILGVDEPRGLPTAFSLSQNYPNPFNPSTHIQYAVPKESRVTLEVYNLLGEKIATLVDGVKPAGYYDVDFNAGPLGSGLYFYRLSSNGVSFVRKMMLVK